MYNKDFTGSSVTVISHSAVLLASPPASWAPGGRLASRIP